MSRAATAATDGRKPAREAGRGVGPAFPPPPASSLVPAPPSPSEGRRGAAGGGSRAAAPRCPLGSRLRFWARGQTRAREGHRRTEAARGGYGLPSRKEKRWALGKGFGHGHRDQCLTGLHLLPRSLSVLWAILAGGVRLLGSLPPRYRKACIWPQNRQEINRIKIQLTDVTR